MNLDKVVKVRRWDYSSQEETVQEVTVREAIENPFGLHMADLGFHLLNLIRESEGKPSLEERVVVGHLGIIV